MNHPAYPSYRFKSLLAFGFLVTLIWAGPARSDQTISLDEVQRGTLLIPSDDEPGRYRSVPLQETQVEIHVSGPVVRARVLQRFTNPGDLWTEATYAFPLPEDAAVDQMRMILDDRVIEAEVKEKAQARATYEQAKATGQRTGLIEQHRPNLFTTSVANIAPNAEIEIEIQYQQILHWRGEEFSLRFPLGITPRYRPGSAGTIKESVAMDGGWAILPGEIPNTARIVPPDSEEGTGRLNPVKLSVIVNAGFPLDRIDSPHHPVDIRTDPSGVTTVTLQDSTWAERDFELTWAPQAEQAPRAAFFTEQTEAGNYGLLMVMPPSSAFADQSQLPRETVFVIDTSGSMGGASIRQARSALITALNRLDPGDRFNLIQFNSTANALFPQAVQANQVNVEHAIAYTQSLEAKGGTEMTAALGLALSSQDLGNGHLRQIIFITDGAVSNEEQLLGMIHRRLGNRRLFTVGIGSAPNAYFMTEAAHFGRGTFTYIGSADAVTEKMNALLSMIEDPALTDIRLDLPVESEVLPAPIPDLYRGEPIVAVMKLVDLPVNANVSGNIGDLRWNSDLSMDSSEEKIGLGTLWGRRKIQQLMRAMARGGDSGQLRAQAVAIGLQHHIVSRYTSLVAVDVTPARPAEAPLSSHHLQTNTPAGWVPPKPSRPAVRIQSSPTTTVAMAQGATPSRLYLLAGLLLIVSALWLRPRNTARPC